MTGIMVILLLRNGGRCFFVSKEEAGGGETRSKGEVWDAMPRLKQPRGADLTHSFGVEMLSADKRGGHFDIYL